MPLSLIALWLGLAFASGLSFYGTVALLAAGLTFRWVADLPAGFGVLVNLVVVGGACALWLLEFVLNRMRPLDNVWDALHTFIRPPGAAFLSFLVMGDASLPVRALAAVVGGTLAFAVHSAKASVRFAANASPEPYSRLVLSLGEPATVMLLLYLTLFHPTVALAAVGGGLLVVGFILPRVLVAFFRAVNRTLDALLAGAREGR
jgi:hypothetical protein